MQIKRSLAVASALVLLVVFLGAPSGGVKAAKTDEVKVVNTAAEAVPVNVGNASLPVTIGNSTVPVSLANTSATPLYVDGDPARAGVGASCSILLYNGESQCTLAAVPTGKILVIESVTCAASVTSGSSFLPMVLIVPATAIGGGVYNMYHSLVLANTGSFGTNTYYGLTTPLRLYAAGGYSVLLMSNTDAASHSAGCSIAGHLVAR